MRREVLGVLAAVGLLAGCTGDISKRPKAISQGTPFTQALTQEYKTLAAQERAEGDTKGAAYFQNKGSAAAAGAIVPLEDPANYALGDAAGNALSLRKSLSLDPKGDVREALPEAAATAQVKFDCWIYELAKGAYEQAAACRKELMTADDAVLEYELRGVIGEPGGEPTVYFDFDQATLTHMGQQVVNQVLAEARMYMPSAVAVTGYTDTRGGAAYNLALGLRRANRVCDALIAGGIPAGIITVASKGMADPAFPTGPGIKEAKNRRVEISMSP